MGMRTHMGMGTGTGRCGSSDRGCPRGVQRWRFCSQPPPLILSLPEGRWGSTSCSPPKDTAAGTPAQGWVWEGRALPMEVTANGDAAGTRGVAGAHLPEAVGRFLGGRRRLVVGTRHGSRGGLGRRCGRSVALGQAAASCTGGSRGVGGAHSSLTGPSRDPQHYLIPSHCIPVPSPSPCPAAPGASTQLQGTRRGQSRSSSPPVPPTSPPQGAMHNPDPAAGIQALLEPQGFLCNVWAGRAAAEPPKP